MSGAAHDIGADSRRRAMLRTAMGPTIAAALADPLVIEVMVNPDGVLRLDRLGEGRVDTGVRYDPAQIERIVRLVASHARTEVHGNAPIVSAELPPLGQGAGERFEGVLPPVAPGPCFSIRKPASRVHRLADYVADGIMTEAIAAALAEAVIERREEIGVHRHAELEPLGDLGRHVADHVLIAPLEVGERFVCAHRLSVVREEPGRPERPCGFFGLGDGEAAAPGSDVKARRTFTPVRAMCWRSRAQAWSTLRAIVNSAMRVCSPGTSRSPACVRRNSRR